MDENSELGGGGETKRMNEGKHRFFIWRPRAEKQKREALPRAALAGDAGWFRVATLLGIQLFHED